MITDINGKLTIDINTKDKIICIWFNNCIIYSQSLIKNSMDIWEHLVFFHKNFHKNHDITFSLPRELFTLEQIDFLKNF